MTEYEKRAEWESEQDDLDNCCDVRGGQDRCGDCPKDRGLARIAPAKVFPEPRQDSAVFGAPRPAPIDYTPTTRGVRQGYASGRNRRGEMQPVAAKKAFDRWLAQYTAEKRAEWDAEQGETEWEDRTPWRGLRTGIRRSDTLAAKEAEAHVWSPRTRSEVLPVSDTASESREERSPADDPAPHWAVISAGNIVIAQGYCWCNDPNGGYHQIGIKPAPVPDTTNTESEDE